MQDTASLHFSHKLNNWFDSFKYFTNKNRFNFLFFDSPQMEVAYCENYASIQERMEFIKEFTAFDEINDYIKITLNGEKSRCEVFLKELRHNVERLEYSKTECWLKSMIENFENENTQFAGDIMPPALYQMMHELYYLWNDAVSDCNKIFALHSDLPIVLPPQLPNVDDLKNSIPLVGAKGLGTRQKSTMAKHLEYVNFYIKQRIDLNSVHDRAVINTTNHFGISEKTLKRSVDENKNILDNYNLTF